ncbi:transcriptional regulator family: Fungal Specific TF [Penicillium alfredii]|uniref:Transcriptional regulator family: Fungal Specific TF n=1 Tax=Penicillium alfredii TaxID=1506179 RepID=A0A9W9GA44_9EURO|nr:transcriptional regulator family: Fungal Specific TF [Penicillium alfredii]KAJ5114678.1 transcriptional regulator family: Fungal Specific TF [Penicillium alfredii]
MPQAPAESGTAEFRRAHRISDGASFKSSPLRLRPRTCAHTISPISGRSKPRALAPVPWGFYIGRAQVDPDGLGVSESPGAEWAALLNPPSDFRSPRLPRPPPGVDSMQRSSEPCEMEKTPPVTGKRRGGSRKACNECKQQKLRCDIVQTPAAACSRCRRLGIDCKVEQSFKRISKRRRNAEMEKEIADLRSRLSHPNQEQTGESHIGDDLSQCSEEVFARRDSATIERSRPVSVPVEPHPAMATPLTMQRDGSIPSQEENHWRLEDVSLSRARVSRLFEQYFTFYHPFLPLLNPPKPAEVYLNRCPLLAWTIICVASRRSPSEPGLLSALSGPFSRLLWSTITNVPQDYRVVKALCVLCTWPLPTTSQRTDATFMLSGLMMQIAMQLGLHRPVQAEEFTTFRMEVQGEALKDRLHTWVICNIVAQNVATGYGQPPSTIYDWALEPASLKDADYRLPDDLAIRLRIEKFCDRVTKALYSSKPEPAEFISAEKLVVVQILESELREMEVEFGREISAINMIHLRAAELHFRYFVFLGSSARSDDLTKLFIATTSFLGRVLDLETSPGELIGHSTNYILQMIVSAAFALMKLLKSSFSRHIDFNHGKLLFNGAISAIRRISVMDHDRPIRLADILAQMWNATGLEPAEEDTLQLKVRCRMSMSHVYDTVWRWRQRFRPMKSIEELQGEFYSRLLQLFDFIAHSYSLVAASANQDLSGTVGPLTRQQQESSLEDPSLMLPAQFDEGGAFFSEAGFSEVFDSLNWVFEGIPDSFVAPPVL